MSVFKDLMGQRFGRLTVVCSTSKRQNARVIWLCRCDCGNLTEVASNNLLTGDTKSCGCLWKERSINGELNFKHGDALHGKRPRFYVSWRGIKQRCLNPSDPGYKYYGERGITICDEWLDYKNFRDWALNNGYADNLTIDRIDNNGNYEPSNCQWITKSENSRKAAYRRWKT